MGIKNHQIIKKVKKIAEKKYPFASRGDHSGTNKKELSLWKAASISLKSASGTWYRETGSGMGATLNIASGMNAYTLTDRATWLNFKNKGNLKLLFEKDKKLFNDNNVIIVTGDWTKPSIIIQEYLKDFQHLNLPISENICH